MKIFSLKLWILTIIHIKYHSSYWKQSPVLINERKSQTEKLQHKETTTAPFLRFP